MKRSAWITCSRREIHGPHWLHLNGDRLPVECCEIRHNMHQFLHYNLFCLYSVPSLPFIDSLTKQQCLVHFSFAYWGSIWECGYISCFNTESIFFRSIVTWIRVLTSSSHPVVKAIENGECFWLSTETFSTNEPSEHGGVILVVTP